MEQETTVRYSGVDVNIGYEVDEGEFLRLFAKFPFVGPQAKTSFEVVLTTMVQFGQLISTTNVRVVGQAFVP